MEVWNSHVSFLFYNGCRHTVHLKASYWFPQAGLKRIQERLHDGNDVLCIMCNMLRVIKMA